jgi:hypothetical protein
MTDERFDEIRNLLDSKDIVSIRQTPNGAERNRDEFNDVMNYAPSEYQQTYDLGTDDAGNPILGSSMNNALEESAKPKKPGVWTNGVNAAEASGRILADEEGGETNLPELIDGGRVDLGQELSKLHEKAKDTSLYAQYMYSADDWAEKGKEIFDKTGMDVNSIGNKEIFEKAWNLTKEIKRQEALATDANGHVDMDKVYEAMPYLRDIHEAHGTAAAVMVMQSAKELQTINDIYQGEGERFAASVGYGIKRGGLQLVNQYTGAKAMLRGLVSNEGLTSQEINDILWVTNELRNTPQFSYSSAGSLLGGVIGSAAENAPIMLPEMARTAAVNLGKLTGPVGTAASAFVYALMSAQIGGAQYIENITKTDENGNPIYTPRQAALLSAAQGLSEAYLEKQSIAAAGKVVFNAGTAKRIAEIYAKKDAALAAGQTAEELTRQIIGERIRHAAKAGFISIAAESEEEFEQQVSDMVLENIAQIAIRGDQADVSSLEDILAESFDAAVQAVPATVGFGLIGAGGSVVANSKELNQQILSARQRFENAQASQYARNIYENERRNAITAEVRAATPEKLDKSAPDVYAEILDKKNEEENFVYTQVDLRTLMADEKNKDLVDTVIKLSGATEEEVQECLRPDSSGMLNVKTSALQRAQNITPEQQQVLNQHTAHNGKKTNHQIVEEAKRIRESLKAVEAKTDEEKKAAIENFARGTFADDEATQKLAIEAISENPDNPALVVRSRMKANEEAINEILGSTIEGLKAEGGQGTSVVETMDENGDVQTGRVSNNPVWYQNFYADYGRAPTNADYERIAYENATGTATRYAMQDYGNLTPEDVAYFEGVKRDLDALFVERESLRKINAALGNVRAGEFLATASLSAEGREAYNELIGALGTVDNKKVRQAARAGAIFAARMAERVAQMWREAGEKKTAKDVMPQVLEKLGAQVQDKSALNQTETVSEIAKEANTLYDGYIEQHPDVAEEKKVSGLLHDAFQMTLDFGADPKTDIIVEGQTSLFDEDGKPIEQKGKPKKKKQSKKDKETKRGKILGLGITRELVNEGVVSLVGKRVRSTRDLAEIAQVLRHPGYEKFHVVYVDANNRVVHHSTVSCRLPGQTSIIVKGEDWSTTWQRIFEDRDKHKADRFYFIHNHPSGDPTPSQDDINLTKHFIDGDKRYAKDYHPMYSRAFAGHIIVDHNKYSVIDRNGKIKLDERIKKDTAPSYDVAEVPHDALYKGEEGMENATSAEVEARINENQARKINSPDNLDAIINLAASDAETTAFFLTQRLTVRAVQKLHDNFGTLSPKAMLRYLRYCARATYGARCAIATSNFEVFEKLRDIIMGTPEEGIVDVVYMKNNRPVTHGFDSDFAQHSHARETWFGRRLAQNAERLLEVPEEFARQRRNENRDEGHAGIQNEGDEVLPQRANDIPAARKETLFSQIEEHIDNYIASELQKGTPLADILAEFTAENPAHLEGLFGGVKAVIRDLELNKDNYEVKLNRLETYKHLTDVRPDMVDAIYQRLIDDLKGVLDYGGFLYREIGMDRQRNHGLRDRVVSWSTAEDQRNERVRNAKEKLNNGQVNESRTVYQGGFSNAQNLVDVLSQAAWHGSGAIFDHFDLGYVGTGEGAQVHGYGIYFSQDRKIAEGYKERLSNREIEINGKVYDNPSIFDESLSGAEQWALGAIKRSGFDKNKAIADLKESLDQTPKSDKENSVYASIKGAISLIENDKIKPVNQDPGTLFEVEIPDDDVLLDEQKHYKEQSKKVQNSMRALLNDMSERQLKTWIRVNWGGPQGAKFTKEQLVDSILISCRHGGEFYQCLTRVLKNDQRNASLLLNQYGIKGITYEGMTDGRCYVVFDDQAISIIDTYNQQVNGTSRGTYSRQQNLVSLFENADQSTFMHEMSHFYLNQLAQIAAISPPDSQAAKDYATAKAWAGWHDGDAEAFKGTAAEAEFAYYEEKIKEAEKNGGAVMEDGTTRTKEQLLDMWEQEKFARGFEDYLRSGNAPSSLLQKIFRSFVNWLTKIYKDVVGVGVKPSAEVEAVMARMVATDEEIEMMATMRAAESIANVAPELLDENTAAMHARWSEEAKEEAKEKLRKELLKEWTERDVDAHMKDFEELEAERLQNDPAFEAALLVSEGGVSEEDAAKATGYGSVEAWKKDLEEKGGSYEAALAKSMKAERDRFQREMIKDDALIELAEEAIVSTEYAERLAALEAEAIKRREKKYATAPKRLANALAKMETALDTENLYDPLKAAFRELKYAERWSEAQQKQIEEMQATIDELTEEKQELRNMASRQSMRNAEERKEAAEKAEADKEKLKARSEKSKAKLREKLKAQLQAFKDATAKNAEWLRGVRDAVKGNEKLYRQIAKDQLDNMSAADATNWRKYMEEARKASKECARHLANAVRKQNGKGDEDAGERDFELARQAKMREALFIAQAREAAKRKKELSRIVAHLKRREKALAKDKNIDASSRYYINHLLYMMGFRKSDALVPMTLESFSQHMNALKDRWNGEKGENNIGDLDVDFEAPAWLAAMVEARDGMRQKIIPENYKDYKMSEIEDLKTLVDILYKTARNKNRLLTMEKSVVEAVQEIMQDYQKTVTVEKGEEGISEFYSQLLQPIVMLRTLGKAFVKYIYNPMFDGWEAKTRMSMEAAETLNTLFAKYWNKKERRAIRKKELDAELPDGTKLTKEMVLALALNWGNDGNRLRVINGWTKEGQYYANEATIEDIFRKYMTEKDWTFIQEAWDFINTFGDKVNEVMERSTGAPMKRVEPRSFVIKTADGEFVEVRGGYYPIAYDPEKSTTVSDQDLMTASKAMGGASTFGTGMGSTKARSETGLQESPLLLSIDVLFRHVNQQIHIAAMRLACRDAYKILTDKSVKAMVEQSLGMNAYKQLKRWVEANWNEPRMDGTIVDRWIERLRRNTVAAIMGYRMSTALLNLANPVYMSREMGAMNALSSFVNFYKDRKKNRAWCLEQSPFLRNRANNIDRDLNNTAKNSFAPSNPLEDVIQRTANRAIEETDMLCSLPAYYGTYQRTLNAKLEKGATQEEAEKEAHRAAEDVVRRIFGSSDTLDQSAMQRSKSALTKVFTPFYTFAATQANAVFDRYMKARYQGSTRTMTDDGRIEVEKKNIFSRYGAMVNAAVLTYILGTLAEQLLRECINKATGDDDKDKLTPEQFARRWAAQSLSGFTSGVPVLNIFGERVGMKITGESYPTRTFGIASAAIDRGTEAFNAVTKFAEGKKDWIDTGRTIAKGAGAYYGFPDTLTDAVFNAARALDIDASFQEWFMKSLFDRKLKAKKGR